jgi:hypothetical protein
VCVLVVAGAFTIGCCSLESEAKVRLVGMYVQLGGIIAVVSKLMEARRLFPSRTRFWQRFVWLSNWLFPPPPIEASLSATEEGDRASMRGRVSPSADTPLSGRVELLEQYYANLYDEVGRVQERIEKSDQRFSDELHTERAARERADSEIKQALEKATVGSLPLDYLGVVAVIVGTFLQGASKEIAHRIGELPCVSLNDVLIGWKFAKSIFGVP